MVDGPVALITGAARGIGAATARQLAAAGWRLVLVDRAADDDALPYALASLEELHAVAEATDAIAVVGDVRDQAALDGAVTAAVTAHGRLDAAIGVAGAMAGGPLAWETDDDAWRVNIGVNLEGVHRLARAAVPALLAQPEPRRGRFVAVSSAAGTTGRPRLAAYAAAKHGVIGYVKSLAIELGPFGITANAVAPGATRGALLDASAPVYDLDGVDEFVVHHPLGRLLEPDDVAAAIAWLCSDAASGVTGVVLPIDAGMTAG
jgi:SDR family mycofactocin-dependent oxidoreductase